MLSSFLRTTPRHLKSDDIAKCSVVPMKKFVDNTSEIHTAAFRDTSKLFNNEKIEQNSISSGNITLSSNHTSVRNKNSISGKKGKWAVGPTKTGRSGKGFIGKMRGLKVYDGQRVPPQTMLVNQMRPVIFPGWNVSWYISRFGDFRAYIGL